jgi:hypothetical protein
MNRNVAIHVASIVGSLTIAASAQAQTLSGLFIQPDPGAPERDVVRSDHALEPVKNAVELTIGTGYEQGFGKFSSKLPSLTDVGTGGGAVQVGVGYRIIPQLSLGLYASGAAFGQGDQVQSSADLYSAASGVQVDWHILPGGYALDPWVSIGSGWRGYWIRENGATTSLQGIELAKLQVGVDYRLTRSVSISPVLGVDLSTFLTEETPGENGFHNVASPEVNTFFFAGLMGRFDIPTKTDRSREALALVPRAATE